MLKLYRQMEDGTEQCLYVESSEPLTEQEAERIVWLAAETFEPTQTRFEPFLPQSHALEIGPRLSVETPFSSNAVAICHSMGLTKVTRIEQSRRYPISITRTGFTCGKRPSFVARRTSRIVVPPPEIQIAKLRHPFFMRFHLLL